MAAVKRRQQRNRTQKKRVPRKKTKRAVEGVALVMSGDWDGGRQWHRLTFDTGCEQGHVQVHVT